MTPVTVATIRLLGDHPVLDFTNTVHSRGADFGPDVLTEFCDLLSWGVRVGVIDTAAANELRNLNAKRSKAALGRAKALREALYRILPRTRPLPRRISTSSKRRRGGADDAGARVRGGRLCLALAGDRFRYDYAPHCLGSDGFDYVTGVRPRACLSGGQSRLAIP